MVVQAREVALLGGELCLDFANTIDYRGTDLARELLVSYSDLVLWSQHVELLNEGQVESLLAQAQQRPLQAKEVMQRAIALRETICRLFAAIAEGRSPDAGDLDALNRALSSALSRLRVVPSAKGCRSGAGFAWEWAAGDARLEQMLWPIVRSAADLLTSDELPLVKQCAGCDWLFVDRSRNHSRRWCDMRYCGNRAKARRYYARQSSAGQQQSADRQSAAGRQQG
jgi:predicted RNA-binding Zn ribbon-like protein